RVWRVDWGLGLCGGGRSGDPRRRLARAGHGRPGATDRLGLCLRRAVAARPHADVFGVWGPIQRSPRRQRTGCRVGMSQRLPPIPLADVCADNAPLAAEIRVALEQVLTSGRYI